LRRLIQACWRRRSPPDWWCWRPMCRWASPCSGAASSSSILPWRKWPRWVSSSPDSRISTSGGGGFGTQLAAGIAALGAAALLTFCERRWAGDPGGADRSAVRLRRRRRHPPAGRQPARRRASARPPGRPDPVDGLGPDRHRRRAVRRRAGGPGVARARRGGGEGLAFYALFAVAVTASVQLVGVLLVFASLIAPAGGDARVRRLAASRGGVSGGSGGLCRGPGVLPVRRSSRRSDRRLLPVLAGPVRAGLFQAGGRRVILIELQ
jgi:hypothetical protein